MIQITNEHLTFVKDAKEAFENNNLLETYRDYNDMFIALRTGEDRDCIMIFRLDGYVANFVQQMAPTPLERLDRKTQEVI